MLQKKLEKLPQVQNTWLAVDQRHHVHAEAVLQLGQLEQIVEDDLGDFAALELDHHAHAGFVGLVAQVGYSVELFLAHQLADAREQRRLVHLIGKLVDDDRLAPALFDVLDVRAGSDYDAPAAGAIAFAHALGAVDDSGGGKVGRRNVLDQLVDRQLRIVEQGKTSSDDLGQVVRRNIGRHPHRDARRAVDQQIRNPRRKNRGLELLAVVIRHEIDRLLVDIGQHLRGNLFQPAFGVSIGGRGVTVDRAEVALSVDQRITKGKILHHP